ncbi:hypothetical protein SNE510_19000 [Streptomyces sp. NE5-10]|uniref:hypothetical protein n=1 Tax=Streptomyces sp. NE5-10 TaxID=2759674 RepID=UPI0019058B2D|nr:hypothetical protein [Streptomyces sp. NE5-10]GHJ92381.1 hypothetical protein SNE510_19000 [Streptomyces sp. NE5-10]
MTTRNTKIAHVRKHGGRLAAVCALAALLAGTAACTSDGDARPAATQRPAGAAKSTVATACADGTFAWINVEQRDVLTGVAAPQRLGKGGGRLTNPMRSLHTPRTEATTETGPKVDAAAALRSLGRHVGGAGEDAGFSEVGRSAPGVEGRPTSLDGPGTIVEYAFVREVVADFRYTCPDARASTGRATGWMVDGTGLLDCDEPVRSLEDSRPARAAARLSCRPDAPAAKG